MPLIVENPSGIFAYRNIGISKLFSGTALMLKENFNIRSVNIREDEDLIKYLNNNPDKINYLAIDAEECLNLARTNPYDYLRMLSTILHLKGSETAIIIIVSDRIDNVKIKEFMKIPEVKGIMPRFNHVSVEEFNEAIEDLKNNRFHVSKRIRDRLAQKKENTSY